jgi:hypothetical protein
MEIADEAKGRKRKRYFAPSHQLYVEMPLLAVSLGDFVFVSN